MRGVTALVGGEAHNLDDLELEALNLSFEILLQVLVVCVKIGLRV